MSVLGYRDLPSSQRVGGWYAALEDAEAAADHLSFPVWISDDCPGGGRHKFFLVPASAVQKEDEPNSAPS